MSSLGYVAIIWAQLSGLLPAQYGGTDEEEQCSQDGNVVFSVPVEVGTHKIPVKETKMLELTGNQHQEKIMQKESREKAFQLKTCLDH